MDVQMAPSPPSGFLLKRCPLNEEFPVHTTAICKSFQYSLYLCSLFFCPALITSIIVGVVLLYSLFNLPQKEGTIHESKDFYVFGLL